MTVKVYRVKHRSGYAYTVCWHAGGRRQQRQFAKLSDAQDEAALRAAQLNSGRIEAAKSTMGVEDSAILAELRRLAAPLPPVSAIEEWARAREICGGHLIEAARAWAEKHSAASLPDVTVEDAVARFVAAKKRSGVDVRASYLRQLGRDERTSKRGPDRKVPSFLDAFRGQLIRSLTHQAIQAHLDSIPHPVSRNTRRTRIVTLFRWARKAGLLPQDLQTAAERTDAAQQENPVVGVITAEQLRRAFTLVRSKKKAYIPALALAALCGMRRSEVHAQEWKDIDLDRKFVRVTKAKRGTPARRLVPLNEAAIAWLSPFHQESGPVCENLTLDRVRDICRTADLDLADNGFRHSYISARVAVDSNVPSIALDAGNSPKVIFRHYRELMRPEEGADYLGVLPEPN